MASTTVPLFINGKEIVTDITFDVIGPTTGQVQHKSSDATATHAIAAVEAAQNAFPAWSQTTPGARREIFLKAANVLDARTQELSDYLMTETGGTTDWAAFNVMLGRECLLGCAGSTFAIEGKIPSLQDPKYGGLIVKESYGVIFAVAPWNGPYPLGFRAVAWAIAAGNTVVLKGSELSPRTLWAISSVFKEAGLPDGVLNFITSSPANAAEVTKTIIEHPFVKKINFTGSTNVGRIIAKLAGENLKPVLLELGGKAPAIVCDDADLDVAAKECAIGAFANAGQVCMCTERIIVHEKIATEFEAAIKTWVDRLFAADQNAPVLVQAAAVTRNKALMKDAAGKGARVVHGDVDASEAVNTHMRPIVISGVTSDMDIYKQESFGPTVSIITYSSDEEAIRVANDTEYGLSSAVFSKDLRRAMRIARQIETGAVHINRMTVQDEAALPHGGAKASGFGRFNGVIDEWVRTKNITFDL